jgi:hypothetical protein
MVNARETVEGDTPAASATSWMVAFIWHPFATRQQPAVLRCLPMLQTFAEIVKTEIAAYHLRLPHRGRCAIRR